MISIKDAIENGQNVKALHIGLDDLAYCTSENIKKFTDLKNLAFHATNTLEKSWADFPESLLLDSIEELDVSGVRVPDFTELNLKKLKAVINGLDFPEIVKHFSELEELTLIIDGPIVIDEAFTRLSKLKKLVLRFNSTGELSFKIDDLSKLVSIKYLELRSVPGSVFAKQWCSLGSLKELVLLDFGDLTEFPQEISRFKALTDLRITHVGTRKKGWDDDDFFDDNEPVEMPEEIALLSALKVFKSNFCAYENFEPLSRLKALVEISIESAQLKKVPDLKALKNLETLNIPDSYRLSDISGLKGVTSLKNLNIRHSKVKNLSPIYDLKQLETINIESTPVDDNKYTLISALTSLKSCKSLKEIDAESLSQEDWDALDKVQYQEKLSNEEILSICKDAGGAGSKKFERACLSILNFKEVFEGEIEEVADFGERDKISFFDKALNQYISGFGDETLIHLIEISFADTRLMDSYELTIIVLHEAIRRKSVSVQDAMAKAFIRGQSGYDSGHRFFGSSVFDTLVDELFSEFEEGPLARVLLETDEQLLYSSQCYGDDVGDSFYDYFRKATDRDMAITVLARYKEFVFEEIARSEDEEDVDYIFESLKKLEGNSIVKEEIAELTKVLSVYSKAVKSERVAETEIFIREVMLDKNSEYLKIVDWKNVFEFEGKLKDINAFDFDICYELLMKYIEIYNEDRNKIDSLFTLLYVVDKNKLQKNIIRDLDESKLIDDIRYDSIFNLDVDAICLYRRCLSAEINGEDMAKFHEAIKAEEAEKEILEAENLKDKFNLALESELEDAFDETMNGTASVSDFIACSLKCVKEHNKPESLAYGFALYSTKLIINYLQIGDFGIAKKLFHNYVDLLLPRAGMHEKTSDVASNALVLGIHAKDQEVCNKIFGKLLGGDDYDVTQINNEILLFNISCYFAIHEDKAALLPAVKQALKRGKRASEFMHDDDFSQYHEDEDFLEVLKE